MRQPYIADAIIIGLAVGVFGAAFGVFAVNTGLSVAQTSVMSLLVFTGASQFAAVGVIAAGGTQAAAVISALLLAARNGFYGLIIAPQLQTRGWRNLVAAHLTIDESTAFSTAQGDERNRSGAFWAAGLSVFVFWNLGTIIGAVAGSRIGDPATFGLDAAFPAGFVALMAPALRTKAGALAAAAGAAIALSTTPVLPPGLPIVAAAFGAVLAFSVVKP